MSGEVHKALVLAAAAWLKKKHSVVITDMVSATGETPDAIGWAAWHSTLIECKASRSDFLADKHKRVRVVGGMGNRRYYLAPVGIIPTHSVPPSWGLLEYQPNGKVIERRPADPVDADANAERTLLISAMRRIGQNPPEGISVKCYTLETKRTATIGIRPAPIPQPEGATT